MATAAALSARQRAAEGQWFNTEGQLAVIRHLEKMVKQGKIDRSVLEAAERAQQERAPQVVSSRSEYVYQHTPGLVPAPRVRDMSHVQLGTRISLGRARWTTDDASIFSVADGKRLASTPPTGVTYQESVRMARIQRAALQTPVVGGLRLLPEMTPGRAFLWGSILALWGTGALVATAARQLEINTAEEAPGRLRQLFSPLGSALRGWMDPLRQSMSINAVAGDALRQETQQSELVRRLRSTLASQA